MNLFLGLDLGTSSVKVALISGDDFSVVKSSSAEYVIFGERPGYAEQDPNDWWRAIKRATQEVMVGHDPQFIRGIGVDGQMHGVVCVNADGKPVRPSIIWADTRSIDEVNELAARQPQFKTAVPGKPSTGFAAASLRWLSKYEPETLAQTVKILFPKDAVRAMLTGQFATEPSDASATWLFDMEIGGWSKDISTFCGLRPDQLPDIHHSIELAGGLTSIAADELGLYPDTPVVMGCADLPAQALGHGIINPGDLFVTVGSGGQVFSALDHFWLESEQNSYTFNHAVKDRWYGQTAMLSAGLSLRWLRDLLRMRNDPNAYAKLSQWASEVPSGSEGLIFLPYLSGERNPHSDPNAAGMFLGLRLHHTAGHMARAVMEGVCFGLLDCINILPSKTGGEIVLSGGITQSDVWTQIAADIWNCRLQAVSDLAAPACVGGAMLASIGTKFYSDFSDARGALELKTKTIEPKKADLYEERYAQYKRLYGLLKSEMHSLVGN